MENNRDLEQWTRLTSIRKHNRLLSDDQQVDWLLPLEERGTDCLGIEALLTLVASYHPSVHNPFHVDTWTGKMMRGSRMNALITKVLDPYVGPELLLRFNLTCFYSIIGFPVKPRGVFQLVTIPVDAAKKVCVDDGMPKEVIEYVHQQHKEWHALMNHQLQYLKEPETLRKQ